MYEAGLPSRMCPSDFQTKFCVHFSSLSYVLQIPDPILWSVQITKPIMQFSNVSCYFNNGSQQYFISDCQRYMWYLIIYLFLTVHLNKHKPEKA
jgi:hypothetical protein